MNKEKRKYLALVTGGTRGIGEAICKEFLKKDIASDSTPYLIYLGLLLSTIVSLYHIKRLLDLTCIKVV